jgi:serine protease
MTGRAYDRRSVLGGIAALGLGSSLETMRVSAGSRAASPGREIIVGFEDAATVGHAERAVRSVDALPANAELVDRDERLGYVLVRLPPMESATRERTIAALESAAAIKYAEPNGTAKLAKPTVQTAASSDPRLRDQYAPQMVRAPQAWQLTTGSPAVTVAILDTGVDYKHPDLDGQFTSEPGRDFRDDDPESFPDARFEIHGSHVAGLVAADGSNGSGTRGIADATLVNGRAISENDNITAADLADAIRWAVDRGADLINMSIYMTWESKTLHEAVRYAVSNGTLPIAIAGNKGRGRVTYPGRFEECVAVSAIDQHGRFWHASQYGPNVDVCAPGVQVLSTTPNGYRRMNGTSMAAPITTGVAALGLAVDPTLSPRQLRDRLVETAVGIGLPRRKQGGGRVDAKNMVEAGLGSTPYPVLEGYPFESEIRQFLEAGLLSGYPDDTFRPERSLTRAEFAAILDAILNVEAGTSTDFPDIRDHWAKESIQTVASAGFFGGYPDGTFRPDTEIRKTEVFVAFAGGLGYDGGSPGALAQHYDDADFIPDWARGAVAAVHEAWNGIANYPSDRRLEPLRPATRAEAVKYVADATQQ